MFMKHNSTLGRILAFGLCLIMCASVFTSCFQMPKFNPNVGGNNVITPNNPSNGGIVVIPPDNNEGGNNNGGNNGNNNGNNGGNTVGSVVVGNATAPYIGDVHVATTVEPDADNKVPAEGVNLESATASATIPGGVQMETGATELALTINSVKNSEADIDLSETDVSSSLDVHVAGVAAGNLVPMEVKLMAAALKGLNSTSIKLYHVENGVTVEMTYVPTGEPFTAHNQFKYDPVTGDVTLYIASFSEFAIVNDTNNAWEGGVDHSWYAADATELYIASAEQLWSFSQIVGGMAEGIAQDSFSDKTVTLIADINLGDKESENNENIIFYPIGYNSDDGLYEKTGVAVSTGFYSFMGTFNGNGHTISNFYQNTWEMKGDHNWYDASLQYFRDGMGLFGKVYGGTIKNLTVENFSSDGEITTTGVIAAYADGATFQNISIFNCNPRVYNIGNGGIVGCVGWYAKDANLKTTFTNITVDNTNKISALWGSYDVACGGILGQYYPTSGQSSANYPVNGGIEFTNCHVSAVMDVYNDVCANYQYYAYRYTGMLIGSVRENETIDGRVYPKMDGIKAYGCTVHFGTWNDYYYCEIIDNTTASYTHDYQMSRLTEIKAIDGTTITYLDGTTGTVPSSGRANYVIVDYSKGHGTENATCYHFLNGQVWNHEDAGYHDGENGEKFIDENGDGIADLKEDKQHIYLEFNNLVTGYGWGVTTVALTNLENVNIQDTFGITGGNVEESVEKFESTGKTEVETGSTITIDKLFQEITGNTVDINDKNIVVTVTPVDNNASANAIYTNVNPEDENKVWTTNTLEFSGIGALNISITDYYFCKSTTVTVNVVPTDKFEYKYGNKEQDDYKDFLLRVGNQNTVSLGLLFDHITGKLAVDDDSVNVTINTDAANYTFTKGNTWTAGTLKFNGFTGIVTITIQDETSNPCSVIVEVVDGKNTTSAENATSGNIVLLGDIGSGFTVSGRYTFYGNGFKLNYKGNGQYLNNGLKQGLITVSENGTIDNLRIVMPVYPAAYMYYGQTVLGDYVQGGPKDQETLSDGTVKTRYHYQLSAVVLKGNATLSNCYIYGGRNNVFVDTGDVTIKDTILECGTVANVQIQSNASHKITLENVTTIQYRTNATIGDTSKVMLGAGILVGPETTTNPSIVLNGNFKQYNWITSDDANAVSDTKVTKAIIQGALDATAYNHTVNGKTASNLGIIYMNTYDASVDNKTGLPYVLGSVDMKVSGNTVSGLVFSLQGATEEQIHSDYANADRKTVNSYYEPQFSYTEDLGGQKEEKVEGAEEFFYQDGDTIYIMFMSGDVKVVELSSLVNIAKYSGIQLSPTIEIKDSQGNSLELMENEDEVFVELSAAGKYTITYTVTDTDFYDKDGNPVSHSIDYSWDVTLNVALNDSALEDAYFEFDSTKQKMGYYKPTLGDVKQYIPFLAGLKIYDYNYGSETSYLRFDGDNDFNKVASITVTNKYSGNDALIVVKLTDGGEITLQLLARADSGGGSDYTGAIKTSNNKIYFVNNGGTSNKDTTTTAAYWYVDYYKFTGNNGVTITSAQQTFNSTGSSASTPSGSFGTTIKSTVTFDANGGKCTQAVAYATSASTSITLPTPIRSSDCIFLGWYDAPAGGNKIGNAGETYTPSANITLYAQWGKIGSVVTYDANGGTCGTASATYQGTTLILPTPTSDTHWFTGWYDAIEGGNKIGGAGASYNPVDDITLYAQWSPKYGVMYNANGGSCNTEYAIYEGTALTLPTAELAGYTFLGWYTAVDGGTRIGGAGDTYVPTTHTELFAHWQEPITVTYNANGGTCGTTSEIYDGDLTLPTPTRTGYTFNGWYTAASSGTKIGDAGAAYTPSANITLYAQWTVNSYKVTTSTSNATISGVTNGQSIAYGTTVSVTVSFDKSNSKTFTIKNDTTGETILSKSAAGTYTFTMPDSSVTINASSSGCFAEGTLITLADGTQKPIEEITFEDELLAWDFNTGTYVVTVPSLIESYDLGNYRVINLYFADGTTVRVVTEHGFFDVEENNFVYIDETNVDSYVGHNFVKVGPNGTYESVELVGYEVTVEDVRYYTIQTAIYNNCIAENMFTLTSPPEMLDNDEWFDYFEIGEGMKYDEEKMQADIEKYGLYTYEDFAEYVTYEQFIAFNGPYLKVLVGRGVLTFEQILELIATYVVQ